MNPTGVVEERGMRVRFRRGGSHCHGGQHAPHERSPIEEPTDRTNRAMTTLVGTAWKGCNPIAMIGPFGRGRLVPAIAVIPPPSACGVVAAKLSSSPRTPPSPSTPSLLPEEGRGHAHKDKRRDLEAHARAAKSAPVRDEAAARAAKKEKPLSRHTLDKKMTDFPRGIFS